MKSVWITLEYSPAGTPPFLEAVFESPDIDREVILGGQTVDGVEILTSFVYGKRDAYETLLDEDDGVLEYEITPDSDGFFLYLRRELGERGASLLESISRETVVVVPPITVHSDRTIHMALVGHPDDLGAIVEDVPAGMSVDVRQVHNAITTTPSRLSERQEEALQTAWDLGYYDVPRTSGIEGVADELDCAVSTASELLRRAEARLVEQTVAAGR